MCKYNRLLNTYNSLPSLLSYVSKEYLVIQHCFIESVIVMYLIYVGQGGRVLRLDM